MDNVSPIEMLDYVLEWFAKESDNYIRAENTVVHKASFKKEDAILEVQKKYEQLRSPEFLIFAEQILEKLVKDEYLSFEDDKCSITFEGKMFYMAGGYLAEYKKESNRKFLLSLEKVLLVVGTLLAGLYGLFEIVKAICKF